MLLPFKILFWKTDLFLKVIIPAIVSFHEEAQFMRSLFKNSDIFLLISGVK